MNSFYKDLLVQIEEETSRLDVARLKKVFSRIESDKPITKEFLEDVLKYDYSKKTKSFQELYKVLAGLAVDDFVKNNGQEQFLSIVTELGREPEPSLGKATPTVAVVGQPEADVAPSIPETKEAQEEAWPTEIKEPETIKMPVNQTPLTPFEIKNSKPEIDLAKPDTEDKLESSSVSPAPEEESPQMLSVEKAPVAAEKSANKKNTLLRYLAVGIPTVVLVAGLAIWQVISQKQAERKSETQAAQILKELPKEDKEEEELSNREYEENIGILTRGIETLKQSDKTGLSGYLVYDDKKYIVQKYDKSNGSLVVFDIEGKKTVFDRDWVERLIKDTQNKNPVSETAPSSLEKTEGDNV